MKKRTGTVVAQRTLSRSPDVLRSLKAAGFAAGVGGVAGAVAGSSMGIAALGGAVAATGPLAIVGGLLGAGVVGLWNLFLSGDKRRLQTFQQELESLQIENRALRQQNRSMYQEVLDASSEVARLTADASARQVSEFTTPSESSHPKKTSVWVGVLQSGAMVLYDPECQLTYGQHVLLFLPSLPGYRVFEKDFIKERLTKANDQASATYADAYEQWLDQPTNHDIRKEGIARLVKRAGVNQIPPTPWSPTT